MDRQKGFIATSLLYSFFLVFVTLFIGMVTIYLQNRVYLTKFEDSSKNSIYIREMKEKNIGNIYYKTSSTSTSYSSYSLSADKKTFTYGGTKYNLANCETIYSKANTYYAEGCN